MQTLMVHFLTDQSLTGFAPFAQIKMQETSREYQCSNSRCGYRFLVKSDPEQGNILEIPV